VSLPNVSRALNGLTQTLQLKTMVKTTVDFNVFESVTIRPISAVVQPTEKNKLNADTLDWSREHITLHGVDLLVFGQFVEYKGKDYKVVDIQNWTDYGYCESVCEETKTDLIKLILFGFSNNPNSRGFASKVDPGRVSAPFARKENLAVIGP